MDGAPTPAADLVRPHLAGTAIYKMTGSGNDFVMVDGRHTSPADWSPADIRAICARGTGVGADGLVFVGPGSQPGAIRMIYYNSDGSHASMCGNAALCTTRLAARLGLAAPDRMTLETDAGIYESRAGSDGECAELHLAAVSAPVPVGGLTAGPGERQVVLCTVGVPHLVVLVDDVEQVDVATRGKALRSHPSLGPAGANANFISPLLGSAQWRMRTYERGVEGETLACGTGAVAAACALAEWGLGEPPITIQTQSGRQLVVRVGKTPGGAYDNVWLGGEARLVLRGVIN